MEAGGGLPYESGLEDSGQLDEALFPSSSPWRIIGWDPALVLGSDMNGFLRGFLIVIIGVCILLNCAYHDQRRNRQGCIAYSGV